LRERLREDSDHLLQELVTLGELELAEELAKAGVPQKWSTRTS